MKPCKKYKEKKYKEKKNRRFNFVEHKEVRQKECCRCVKYESCLKKEKTIFEFLIRRQKEAVESKKEIEKVKEEYCKMLKQKRRIEKKWIADVISQMGF